jgi:dienelactone hydrolase
MRPPHLGWILLLVACQSAAIAVDAPEPPGLPPPPLSGPMLCPGPFLTPEQGQAALDHVLAQCPDRATWEARAVRQRAAITRALGLEPLPTRVPLAPLMRERRPHDGYSVENVAFTSVPGYLVTGNLYRPTRAKPPYAVILSPHGHGGDHGRLSAVVQTRCAQLARMGALVLAIDMVAYGESLPDLPRPAAHQTPLSPTLQTWNGMRSLDLLLSLPDADASRVGVTGESGGGTQTFLLAALDPRVTASAPVVMVSAFFFGGCACESGRPIHRSHDHFITNAEIAALAAPRPLLVVSDGKDWTRRVPESEFPFLQRIYALHGAQDQVVNAHFAMEAHDYGPSKRAAVYRFFAARFRLDLAAIQGADGSIDDAPVAIEPEERLRVFTAEHPAPAGAWGSLADIAQAFR